MTTTGYTAPQTEDEQTEEERGRLTMKTHEFDPNTHSAASPYCAAMVMRDGGGDECGLRRDDPAHAVSAEARLASVLALHKAVGTDADEEGTRPGPDVCGYCADYQGEGVEYPCATARAALGDGSYQHDTHAIPDED